MKNEYPSDDAKTIQMLSITVGGLDILNVAKYDQKA